MAIQIGGQIPEAVLETLGEGGLERVDTRTLFDHGQVVMFAVPGAFTPTCSEQHLPGYVQHLEAFRQRGVAVYCLAVNDPFVMQAWAEARHVPAALRMLSDGNGDFVRALGLDMDASAYGMGRRAKRFALYADNGVVRHLAVEAPGELRVSTAQAMLAALPSA